MTTTNEGNTSMGPVIPDNDTLAEAALDAAVATIQGALGQTDGGFAGIYFSGDRGDTILRLLRDYAAAEREHLEGGA